jgi:hypothetical protein
MVKFRGSFHSPLEFGHVVIIGGVTKHSAENLIIDLLSDKNTSDTPLHVNVVFGENEQIIRNTKINGEFGAAETSPGIFTKQKNPLKSGDDDIRTTTLRSYRARKITVLTINFDWVLIFCVLSSACVTSK